MTKDEAAICLQSLSVDDVADVRMLALQYHARLNARSPQFQWPSDEALLRIQDNLVEALGLQQADEASASLKLLTRGDSAYTCTFLKELVARIEDALVRASTSDDDAVNDQLYDIFASLMLHNSASGDGQPQSRSVVHYFPSRSSNIEADALFRKWDKVTVTEESTTISRGTTGLKTWEAALRLAQYCLATQDELHGCRILELGCGAGFLGIFLAKLVGKQAAHITMTDLDGQVLERARATLTQNFGDHIPKNLTLQPVDWIDVRDSNVAACQLIDDARADVVLAADVVFDPELVDALAAVIAQALHTRESRASMRQPYALVASTVRNQSTFETFRAKLSRYGLDAAEIIVSDALYDLAKLSLAEGSNFKTRACGRRFPLLPSLHESERDGRVVLLKITRNAGR